MPGFKEPGADPRSDIEPFAQGMNAHETDSAIGVFGRVKRFDRRFIGIAVAFAQKARVLFLNVGGVLEHDRTKVACGRGDVYRAGEAVPDEQG